MAVELRLSEDSAQAQLDEFLEYYDVIVNELPEEQMKAIVPPMKKVLRGIRTGAIEISTEGGALIVTQNLSRPPGEVTVVKYKELSGKAKVAMKSKGDNDNYGKIYALMGSLSGLGDTAMTGLKGADLSLMECMGALFLLV